MILRWPLIVVFLSFITTLSAIPPPKEYLVPPPVNPTKLKQTNFNGSIKDTNGTFMQRIARWFGYGNSPREQQLQATYNYVQYQKAPQSNNLVKSEQKAPCNPCNKIPWIPMFPGLAQYPIIKGNPNLPQFKYTHYPNLNTIVPFPVHNYPGQILSPQPSQLSNTYTIPEQPYYFHQSPIKDHIPQANMFAIENRAPPFNIIAFQKKMKQFSPVPFPNLSITPIPPIYKAIPFTEQLKTTYSPIFTDIPTTTTQRTTNDAIGTTYPSFPQQKNAGSDADIEFFKSIPVTEYLASVEYPINIEQSPIIDITADQKSQSQTSQNEEYPKLTELGSYTTTTPSTQFDLFSDPIIINQGNDFDNFVAASSHNISYKQENNLDVENYVTLPDETSTQTTTFKPEETTTNWTPSSTIVTSPYKRDKHTSVYLPYNSSPRPFIKEPLEPRVQNSQINTSWRSSSTHNPWSYISTPSSTLSSLQADSKWSGIISSKYNPPTQFTPAPNVILSTTPKRPKQVHQIIIPYTIHNWPKPFKTNDEHNVPVNEDARYSGWSNSHELELHEQQESNVVTATQPPIRRTTKYLTKILASNIRELLKLEHEIKNKTKDSIDFNKLQKNIHQWTQQGFNSFNSKGSTVSGRGPAKHIPSEYFSTATSTSLKRQTTTPKPSTTKKQLNFGPLLSENEIKKFDVVNKLLENNQIDFDTGSQEKKIENTTPVGVTPLIYRKSSSTPSINDLWKKLKVSISPITKEKVYVVTPQPQFHQRIETSLGEPRGFFKSPRFLVRPTPGTTPKLTTKPTKKPGYTPELFGLMGISEYSPPTPVETLDGHSKVITIITPSSILENENKTIQNNSKNSSNSLSFATNA